MICIPCTELKPEGIALVGKCALCGGALWVSPVTCALLWGKELILVCNRCAPALMEELRATDDARLN